jgi:hypothetical protein
VSGFSRTDTCSTVRVVEPAPLSTIRTILIWALLAGSAGTLLELLLIGHDEMATQWAPLVLLGAGVLVAMWTLIAPDRAAIHTLRLLMVFFVASGLVGVILHYKGIETFELEMSPSRAGMSLISKTLTGATPVMAPGSMSLLGLVGLAFAHRHPALRSQSGMSVSKEQHS